MIIEIKWPLIIIVESIVLLSSFAEIYLGVSPSAATLLILSRPPLRREWQITLKGDSSTLRSTQSSSQGYWLSLEFTYPAKYAYEAKEWIFLVGKAKADSGVDLSFRMPQMKCSSIITLFEDLARKPGLCTRYPSYIRPEYSTPETKSIINPPRRHAQSECDSSYTFPPATR